MTTRDVHVEHGDMFYLRGSEARGAGCRRGGERELGVGAQAAAFLAEARRRSRAEGAEAVVAGSTCLLERVVVLVLELLRRRWRGRRARVGGRRCLRDREGG